MDHSAMGEIYKILVSAYNVSQRQLRDNTLNAITTDIERRIYGKMAEAIDGCKLKLGHEDALLLLSDIAMFIASRGKK